MEERLADDELVRPPIWAAALLAVPSILVALRVFFRNRGDTALEIVALRQQVAVLKRRRPRPKLNAMDRLFWITIRSVWSRWADVLVTVKPETVRLAPRRFSSALAFGVPGRVAAGRRSPPKFGRSSTGWRKRVQAGAPQTPRRTTRPHGDSGRPSPASRECGLRDGSSRRRGSTGEDAARSVR